MYIHNLKYLLKTIKPFIVNFLPKRTEDNFDRNCALSVIKDSINLEIC